MEYFILYVLIIIGCYVLADKKNYSKPWAIFWGMVANIFALIVYLLLKPTISRRTPYLKSKNKKRKK